MKITIDCILDEVFEHIEVLCGNRRDGYDIWFRDEDKLRNKLAEILDGFRAGESKNVDHRYE